MYDPLVLLVSNNAYRSFTLNLKPLNQIITIVNKAGGTGGQGGHFFSQILADSTTTKAGVYYAHEIITCPPPPPSFPDLPPDLINIQYLGLEIVP